MLYRFGDVVWLNYSMLSQVSHGARDFGSLIVGGRGNEVHPPSPEAPPLGGEEGEVRVLLRSRADKATAKQNTASERLRPTGVQEGTTGLPVGLHADRRDGLLEVRAAVAEGLAAGKRVGAEAAHEGEESEIGPEVRLCRAPA